MQDRVTSNSDVYTVPDLLAPILRRFWLVALLALAVGIASYVFSKKIEPRYRVTATIAPVNPSDAVSLGGGGSALGQVGRLLDIGGIGQGDFVRDAMGILNSNALIERFINEENLLQILFEDSEDREQAPTISEGVDYFSTRVLTISEDKFSGLLEVSIDWEDPAVAVSWASKFVALANNVIRERTIDNAESGNKYLREELDKNNYQVMREAIYGLMESNIKMAMLATTREELAFKVLDPAALPAKDDYLWPNHALFGIFGFGLGGAIAVALILLWHRRSLATAKAEV